MQNSLQRGPPVLMEADNFVLILAVSIYVDKVVLPLLFPNLFWFHERRNFGLLFIWIDSNFGIGNFKCCNFKDF